MNLFEDVARCPLIMVYGTLMSTHGANYKMQREELVGPCQTLVPFSMYSGGFPIIFPPVSEPRLAAPVLGELYTLSVETLKVLDQYEGYPSFYSRKIVPVRHSEGSAEGNAWVYYQPNFRGHPNTQPGDHGLLEWKGYLD